MFWTRFLREEYRLDFPQTSLHGVKTNVTLCKGVVFCMVRKKYDKAFKMAAVMQIIDEGKKVFHVDEL